MRVTPYTKVIANRRLLLFRMQRRIQDRVIQFLKNFTKGNCKSKGVADNAVREAKGMIRTWKMSVEES